MRSKTENDITTNNTNEEEEEEVEDESDFIYNKDHDPIINGFRLEMMDCEMVKCLIIYFIISPIISSTISYFLLCYNREGISRCPLLNPHLASSANSNLTTKAKRTTSVGTWLLRDEHFEDKFR